MPIVATWEENGVRHGASVDGRGSGGAHFRLYVVEVDGAPRGLECGNFLRWDGTQWDGFSLRLPLRIWVPLKQPFWQRKRPFEERVREAIDRLKQVPHVHPADIENRVKAALAEEA